MENEEFKAQVAKETIERYSGCLADDFCEYLILTNFPQYVEHFAKKHKVKVTEGSMFKVAHDPKHNISILDFKIGSPAAALVVDTCSYLPFKSSIFLGMCGGLRRRYKVGEYLVPVASIRAEGTSDFYFSGEIPALANFFMQRAVTETLEVEKIPYHIGITYTTNMRFWEFNEAFRENLKVSQAQGIEMECATLFISSYKNKFTLGSLLLVSDLPLEEKGAKTKTDAEKVLEKHMKDHIELGEKILKHSMSMLKKKVKGAYK